MLTLYTRIGCPYCAVVLHELDELALPFTEKSIDDEAVAAELIELGGKQQVPYLVDSDRNVAMYESADIAEYLVETYGADGCVDMKDPLHPTNVCVPNELVEEEKA